ncbi:MAG: dTMP kinase [Thermoproteota archaeon]
MTTARRGFHIALEGIDGSGKTTVSTNLYLRFRDKGYLCFYTIEPTYMRVGSIIRLHASRIRNVPQYYLALLFAADRVEHYERIIRKKLEKGHHVISDRYVYSSIAYQGGLIDDIQWVREVNNRVPPPDLAIYLDIDPSEALRRKRAHSSFSDPAVLSRVRKAYLELVENRELILVDASMPLEEVLRKVVNIIREKLGIDLSG